MKNLDLFLNTMQPCNNKDCVSFRNGFCIKTQYSNRAYIPSFEAKTCERNPEFLAHLVLVPYRVSVNYVLDGHPYLVTSTVLAHTPNEARMTKIQSLIKQGAEVFASCAKLAL